MTSREQSQKLTSIASSPLCYAISASFYPQKCHNGTKIVMKLHLNFYKMCFLSILDGNFYRLSKYFLNLEGFRGFQRSLVILGRTITIRPKKCEFNKNLAILCPSNTRRALHKCARKMRSRKTLITLEKHLFVDICIPHAQRKSTVYRCPIILSHWTCSGLYVIHTFFF